MRSFHSEVRHHLIYAILWKDDGEEFAFVGKTISTDTKAVLRRHLRGEVAITATALKREDWDDNRPRIVTLQDLMCTGAQAYKYILCYHRLYEDLGFQTYHFNGTDNQAYDMHPQTWSLYEKLQKTTTRELLRNGIATEKPIAKSESAPKREPTSQLNIRVSIQMLGIFQRFCEKLGITQKEGFLHLLHCADWDALSKDPLFLEQKKIIERQRMQIAELESKLRSESRGQWADRRLKQSLSDIKQFVALYIKLLFDPPAEPPLKIRPPKEANKFDAYHYPESAGEALVELHALYYSHGRYPAVFVCGKDLATETKIKLRYYPKETYLGCSPRSVFSVEKANWLVHYQHAKDGAMDLTVALPLPPYIEASITKPSRSSDDQKSLEDLIQEAQLW